jgi:MFS transporter, DHA2 family, methylenomycin A resistance protein
LLRRRAFVIANGVAGAMNLGTLGLLFVVTLYLQEVRHDRALVAGTVLLPLFAPLSVLAPLGGRIVARTGPRLPMLGGLILAAVVPRGCGGDADPAARRH